MQGVPEARVVQYGSSARLISVAWQEINCGRHRAGRNCGRHRAGRRVDIHLQGPTMQVWDGEELLKTVLRTNGKEVRKKHAAKAS